MPNYIALAVPFFFALIGVELWAARRQGRAVYRLNDSVVDLSTGICQQVSLIFMKAGLFAAYAVVYEKWRVLELSAASPWTWVLAIVLVDLTFYWWHRLSHEVNFLWAAHVVHHSSEEYNLSVALRQSVLTPWTIVPFHAPLALLGVPPVVMLAVDSFNTLYQFWIHTQLIGKLGFIEKWLNTPALHRVHHAINPRYLDKNYGGTFIVWDRLFGTYRQETDAPVYGLVKSLQSFDPFRAQFHYWGDLWKRASITPRIIDKLRVFLKGPPYTPPGMEPFAPAPEVAPASFHKYDPPLSAPLGRYVLVQVALVVAGATTLMFFETTLPPLQLAAGAALVYLAMVAWGGFLEGRRWALPVELARLSLVAALAVHFSWRGPLPHLAGVAAVASSMIMAAWLLRAAPGPAAVSSPS